MRWLCCSTTPGSPHSTHRCSAFDRHMYCSSDARPEMLPKPAMLSQMRPFHSCHVRSFDPGHGLAFAERRATSLDSARLGCGCRLTPHTAVGLGTVERG